MPTLVPNGGSQPGSAPLPLPPGSRRLVLASASPRRRELLHEWGYEFIVQPAEVDESTPGVTPLPSEIARQLALAKARAVAVQFPPDVVLGADTVVALGDLALGKPTDADDARRILDLLSGTTHIVVTGVAVVVQESGWEAVRSTMSAVHMRHLTAGQIDRYIQTGLWQGKAGAYGIQDNDPFVTNMAGSHTNVVGLPFELTSEMLEQVGIRPGAGA
jgi:septum formation protein